MRASASRVAQGGIRLLDALRLARFLRRHAHELEVEPPVDPNLRFVDLRTETGARVRIAAGFVTERKRGNHVRLGRDARLELGARAWLRTEHAENRLTLFPGALIRIGADAFLNGAMLHAKCAITIGCECRIGFGVRLLDSDFHPLDSATPERSEAIAIGDRVWIGADAKVLRGVTIGDDVVVGAGSVVTRDLPSRCLAAGNPARPLREIARRDGC